MSKITIAQKSIKIHYLQHVFEGLASIETWAKSHSHFLCSSRFYQDESLPNLEDFDLLVVMGGVMNIIVRKLWVYNVILNQQNQVFKN
jgi:hypothetical protein